MKRGKAQKMVKNLFLNNAKGNEVETILIRSM